MEPAAAPHVVMIVGNDVTTDTRVRRMATTLARVGVRVTVLGYTPGKTRTDAMLGDVRIVRVPVPWARRDAVRAAEAARRAGRLRVGYPNAAAARLARDVLILRQRENARRLALEPSVAARIERLWLRAQREVVRGRAGVQGKLDARRKARWAARDARRAQVTRGVRWREQLPEIDDYALVFLPVLDELRPDAIHAHDVHMVGIAALASHRLGVPWVYDAHEYVAGLSQYGGRTPRVIAGYLDLEAEFIRDAARVVTVSPQLAEELQRRYALPRLPDLHLNVPLPSAVAATDGPSLRETCGLAEGVPLLVYSGGVTTARGVQTAVEALPELPGVHLAVVAVPHTRTHACNALKATAARLGVADRLHLVEPVAPDEVIGFLRSADVGLIPLLHFGSHEVALTNKLFEYGYAGLPLVVSDCRAQQEFVTEHGVGLVHPAGDAAALAEAVRAVLADPARFRAAREAAEPALKVYAWEAQEASLWALYRELLPPGTVAEVATPPNDVDVETPVGDRAVTRERPVLAVGPSNMAGQGWAWAKAVERALPDVSTEVLALDNGRFAFPADERVAPTTFTADAAWQRAREEHAARTWTHALLEAGRPTLGTAHGKTFAADVPVLRAAGVRVGLVFHGSEIRDPARHAAHYAWSPFADATDDLTARLQRQVDVLRPLVQAFDGPKYVSTPDLLDDVPGATWLPVVVDTGVWTPQPPPLERDVPVVLHVPSNTALKGTRRVEEALDDLVAEGAIDFRRLEGVAPEDMPTVLGAADVVLDQFALGSYGVLACQALAQGRLVVGHVDPVVRARVAREIPIVEATPDTLGEVLRGLLANREAARAVAGQGPEFVAAFHDGTYSAAVLADFLGR